MDDKIRINLQMAGVTFPVWIARQDEERVREVARRVGNRINEYRERYPDYDTSYLSVMVAYEFAIAYYAEVERNDTEPYTRKLTELTHELEEIINE